MSSKTKTFDCVEMKNRIQAELAVKYANMSDAERFAQIEHELMTSDDPLAKWWRNVREAQNKKLQASLNK